MHMLFGPERSNPISDCNKLFKRKLNLFAWRVEEIKTNSELLDLLTEIKEQLKKLNKNLSKKRKKK